MAKQKSKAGENTKPRGRSFWSGTITFGLVSVPVDFFAANKPSPARLRMVTSDGHPVGRRYLCPNHGTVVSGDDIVRGYEIERGKFVPLTDEELESVAPEKTRDINLERFVALDEIAPLLFQRAYFLAPGGNSSKAYRLLAHTMEEARKAGIATFVMRDKSYVVAILAEHGLLRAETLRFAHEIRSPEGVGLPSAKTPDKELTTKIAKAIKALAKRDIDPDELVDNHYRQLEALAKNKYRRKQDVVKPKGEPSREQLEPSSAPIDLVALLKRRLGQRESDGASPGRRTAKEKARGKSGRGKVALEKRPMRELYARAKSLGIEGRSQMKKQDLVKAIRAASA